MESNEHKSKILNSAMRFSTSSYNFGLKVGHNEPNRPLGALQLADCNSDGENVQYGPENLPIEKPTMTSAFKTPTSSSQDVPEKVSDPANQMIDFYYSRGHKCLNFSPECCCYCRPDSRVCSAPLAISKVEPDLAGKLASSEKVQK